MEARLKNVADATVLSTAAFLALGTDLCRAMFAGNSSGDTDQVAYTTMAMMVGLAPFSAQYLFQRVFYAFEDARTPFLVQVPIVVVWSIGNLLSLWLLPPRFIVLGVGLSMTVANTVGMVLLAVLLHRRLGQLDGARVGALYLRLLLAGTVAGVAAWLTAHGVHLVLGPTRLAALAASAIGGLVLIAGYGAVLRALRVTELNEAITPLIRTVGG